ncbi:DUF1289 domain-containing protein [Methyloligella sp. 2.7D]|uniref:DUF1289 domain-containing protein n=1 Tax=unclassified Methyloligella TaxID=2625955 RepID=UPI00157D5622|nr:DUF1289 domain-containing protein [Methyloligella sp. GL2]QKP78167.1 DUF1289 domain-containing protein [Methyloligella sp. GL2]
MTALTQNRHSPCIGICKLDESTGFCLGCGRSGDEIGAWASLDEAGKDAIWQLIPERLQALSVRVRLLPYAGGELLDWVGETIREGRGTWVAGAPGAVAEFPCHDRDATVTRGEDELTAAMPKARFRLKGSEKLRAFAFDGDGPVVLGLPKRRVALPMAEVVTPLGPDEAAIDPEFRDHELFDIGVARRASRFCVRTGDAELIAALRAAEGRHWTELMAKTGATIIEKSPHRVVETGLARIEVFAEIPPPGGTSPTGPHTHLLAEFLTTGEEIPAALGLPEYAAPIAIFYPGTPPA